MRYSLHLNHQSALAHGLANCRRWRIEFDKKARISTRAELKDNAEEKGSGWFNCIPRTSSHGDERVDIPDWNSTDDGDVDGDDTPGSSSPKDRLTVLQSN